MKTDFPTVRRGALQTLLVNVGYLCNQACKHCHVNAGPKRTEVMTEDTSDALIEFLDRSEVRRLDLTGGAPELNPHFRRLVLAARTRNIEVIDRCNLTVLAEPGQEDLADSRISIIVPALNESGQIGSMLSKLQPLRERGHEVIVVDGGSGDKTTSEAKPFADRVLDAPRGRASQLAFGAKASGHPVLWFVHADTWIPRNADYLISEALRNAVWGRFDVRLSGRDCHPGLSVVERFMNRRSRLTGIATGDQGIFVTRAAFNAIGGMPSLPLMEDVELSRRGLY